MLIVRTIVGTLAALALLVAGYLAMGGFDVAADTPHSAVTLAIIEFTRDRSIETRIEGLIVPKLDDPARVKEGAQHYAEMCAECHASPGNTGEELREGMYPQPPDLVQEPIDDDAEAFWTIKHGIKSTGMPAWGASHDDEKIWSMVAFLEALPKLSKEQYAALTANAEAVDEDAGEAAPPVAPPAGEPTAAPTTP